MRHTFCSYNIYYTYASAYVVLTVDEAKLAITHVAANRGVDIPLHSGANFVFVSFQIKWNMTCGQFSIWFLNWAEFHLVPKQRENGQHDHIPLNIKRNENVFPWARGVWFYSKQREALTNTRRGGCVNSFNPFLAAVCCGVALVACHESGIKWIRVYTQRNLFLNIVQLNQICTVVTLFWLI